MALYTATIKKIREARNKRDEEKDKLYARLLEGIALKKQQRKFEQGEAGLSEAGKSRIDEIRKEIEVLQQQLREVEERISAIEHLPDALAIITRKIEELRTQLSQFEGKLQELEKEFRSLQDRTEAAKLADEIRLLRQQIKDAASESGRLQQEKERLQRELDSSHNELGSLRERQRTLRATITRKQGELKETVKDSTVIAPNRSEAITDSGKKIRDQRTTFNESKASLNAIIAELFLQTTPQQLIEQWDDDIPILLLPVRLETKYKLDSSNRPVELWVRVFPDEIAIVTHEKTLTKTEIGFGQAYWKALLAAGNNENRKKDAWRVMAEKFEPNRAAWIAKQTKPSNWGITSNPEELIFPEETLVKPDAWTEAPHSRIMPDKFVLMGYDANDKLIFSSTGKQVKDILITGPAPVLDENETPSLKRDTTTNRIEFDEEYKWIKDFDTAEKEGLGFKILLTDETRNGIDKLLVIGLKLSADDTDGKLLLEELIDNHHYSSKGFSLLKQGTPTNNTEDSDAGFNSKDPLQEISYWVETGDPLFDLVNEKFKKTDGQRLAEYLGIEYDPLYYIANSDLTDHSQAIAMNAALCAGTLDYYLYRMLSPVTSNATNQKIRNHFINHVTGRGPLPSIRVGNQPYGILLTSSFPLWSYPDNELAILKRDTFYQDMLRVLKFFDKEWRFQQSKLATIHSGTNASANLVNVLGLHPSSIDYYQRVAYNKDHVFNAGNARKDAYLESQRFIQQKEQEAVEDILLSLGYKLAENGKWKPTPMLLQLLYHRYHTRLGQSNLIDDNPLSETEKIKPYAAEANDNYIDWLIKHADDHDKLQQQDFGGAPVPNSMLYMMLYFSLITETGHSIGKFLERHDIIATELLRTAKMMNMTSAPSISPWEVFNTPVNLLVSSEGASTPIYKYMHSPRFNMPELIPVVEDLKQQKEALNILRNMHTAELERALAEHIDTLSYRLDSWLHSLFDVRLQAKRNNATDYKKRKTGIYIASFGYLEKSKAAVGKRQAVPEDILPAPLREGTGNLFIERDSGGYVHAPSINHATAAAIVRNGYLSYAAPTEKELLSVNLSSERVRRGNYLIEGLRNGQTLEALLGYQFERGLHDYSTRSEDPVILNHLVPFFRKAFPVKKTKVPQKGNVTGPEETIDDFHVVNGMSIVQANDSFPDGLADLPLLSPTQKDTLRIIRNNIVNTLDAFHDLLVSESAYQLAMGNFDRAAAVVQAISNTQLLPEIEVLNTPRSSTLSLTNRFVIHFNPASVARPWGLPNLTQRAIVETGINEWIATLLPDPSLVQCKIKTVVETPEAPVEGFISLKDLGIQPIDFIYLVRKKMETGSSELETRIRYAFLRNTMLPDSTTMEIAFTTSPGPGLISFAAILPLASHIKELITNARPLLARDYESQSKELVKPPANPDNINTAELKERVNDVFEQFGIMIGLLGNARSNAMSLRTVVAVDALRDKLTDIANAGMTDAFPQSAFGNTDQNIDTLNVQAQSVLKRFETFVTAYQSQMTQVEDIATTPARQVELLTSMIRGMLGEDFVLLPRFTFNNTEDISQAYSHREEILSYSKSNGVDLPADEWLHGASLTRKKLRTFEMVRMISDTVNDKMIVFEPLQIPYRANDNWLGMEYPAGTSIDHDTISLVQYAPQGFEASEIQCGLVVDDWTELIPGKEETTGISFNYNQPNSTPPQTILLAVSPEDGESWKWDHLVSIILDTFNRAKLRAVEPDIVDSLPGITTLLPSIISEFSTSRNNVSLDYGMIVKEISNQVHLTMSTR